MYSSFNRTLNLISGVLFFILLNYNSADCDTVGADNMNRRYPVVETSSSYAISSSERASELSYRQLHIKNSEPEFSWGNLFTARAIEKHDIFLDRATLNEERDRDQIEEMQYELYDGEFRSIEYIRQDVAKKTLYGTVDELMRETEAGRELDRLSRKVSGYLTIQYMESGDDNRAVNMPGKSYSGEFEKTGDLYGISLSLRPFNDMDTPLGYALELNSFYSATRMSLRYEASENRVVLSIRDSAIEKVLNVNAAFEFVSEHSETYGMIKIHFDF